MKPVANFNGVARYYRWLEYAAFGRELERCRFALLPHLAEAQQVLILGEGDGRFLRRLVKMYPSTRVDVVESSMRMLQLTRERLPSEASVHFHPVDARRWRFPDRKYDAIVSCFFLDCFTPKTLRDLVPRVSASVKPGARWLLAEFADEHTLRSRVWLAGLYWFFRTATGLESRQLAPFGELLSGNEWRRAGSETFAGGLLRAECWREMFFPRRDVVCGLNKLAKVAAEH